MTYRVRWDNGASACGVFPNVFYTYETANAFATEWQDECNLRDYGTRTPDNGYWAEVVEETDDEYHERTGEPRGAGSDWAGRTGEDFSDDD